MRHIILLVSLFVLSILNSACGRNCELARDAIIKPSQNVATYLRTNPSGRSLEASGCTYLVNQFKDLPDGAQAIRKIAEFHFSHVNSTCLNWEEQTRWICNSSYPYSPYPPYQPVPMPGYGCYPQTYTYCARWEYDTVREPGYAIAMELSEQTDQTYALAHKLCGDAAAGFYDRAYSQSRELLSKLVGQMIPSADRVYDSACR